MQPIKNNNLGFTLVEMLIVAVTLSIVSLAMYAIFNNGLKIWQRVSSQIPESEVNIFFDKFSLDLKNTVRFSGIKFQG
jgi:Tfp pilus assembly protein PilE